MKILIFGHIGHFPEYAEYINAFNRVGSVRSRFLTMGREEQKLGQKMGAFDAVEDLLPAESELDGMDADLSGAAQSLKDLEKRLGSNFVNRDILMDRFFRGQEKLNVDLSRVPVVWTGSRTKQFMNQIYIRLEEEIASFDPDFILLEPISAPLRMAWRLAHQKGVPAGKFLPVRFWPERLYLETGIGYDWQQARIAYEEMTDKPMMGEELAKVEQRLQAIKHEKEKPAYMKTERARGAESLAKRLHPSRLYKHLHPWLGGRARTWTRNPHVLPANVFSPIAKLTRYRNGRKAQRYLRKHQTPFSDIQSKKYAMYFLHIQPEVSVDGMAFDYQDQENTLRNILASLPADMHLVVKEHSPMLGFRPTEAYSQLVHMPGIIIADPHEDSHQLITHASVVVTLTGTVALEAVLYGIPAIVLGSIYFDNFNGIYKPENSGELKKLLSNADELAGATEADALRALGSILRASVPGRPPLGASWTLREVDDFSAKVMLAELEKRAN